MESSNVCSLEPGNFYVTMRDETGRTAILLGPFTYHKDAIAMVDQAAKKASDINSFYWFNHFGTARIKDYTEPGKLNKYFNI